jgi:DNA-binding response OmpR family regulator
MGHVGSDKQILLIDDDSLLIKVLSLLLTHNGFIVETAQTGAAGLAKAVRHEYDVIILDMGLPDQTGIAVCQKLRWNGVLTPILVLSGDTSKKTIVGGLKTGADDYLEKPFHEAELLERLNALIRRNERLFLSCILKFKSMELDTLNCTVQANYHSLKLTTIEMSVMRCLMQYAPLGDQ